MEPFKWNSTVKVKYGYKMGANNAHVPTDFPW